MNILILGMGVSGKYIYNYFSKQDCTIYIVDDNYKNDEYKVYNSDDFINQHIAVDLIVKSPGIKYDHIILKTFKDVKVTNDIELYYDIVKDRGVKIVGITGTNGKTSTVTLLTEVLKAAKFKVECAGNIGISPLKYIDEELDYIILELSSFQLKQIDKFTTYSAFFLNFTPDHLDYHSSIEDYYESKMKIVKNEPVTKNLYTTLKVELDEINVKHGLQLDLDYAQIDMGLHPDNVELINQFLEDEQINNEFLINYLTLSYRGIEHRVEYVDMIDNVKFYNDSKATNVSAASLSLMRLTNIILLVGGYDKNEDLTTLKHYLHNVDHVIAYGQNKEKFKFIENIVICENLDEAFKRAVAISHGGDSILLSPCSASYDQFKNYVERGNYFKQLVATYKEEYDEIHN